MKSSYIILALTLISAAISTAYAPRREMTGYTFRAWLCQSGDLAPVDWNHLLAEYAAEGAAAGAILLLMRAFSAPNRGEAK